LAICRNVSSSSDNAPLFAVRGNNHDNLVTSDLNSHA
jgi:hypothetical protein